MNLYNAFKKTAQDYSDSICLVDFDKTITYQNTLDIIEEKVSMIGSRLKNTAAIIYLPKSADIIIWQLALNRLVMTFITLEYGQVNRLAQAISQCKPSLIIEYNDGLVTLKWFKDYSYYKDCAYIVFSSGSTGTPKAILLKDTPIINTVKQQAYITHINQRSKYLWLLNPAFDASLSDIYSTILSGGALYAYNIKSTHIKEIFNTIERESITHIDLPPSVFHLFYNHYEKKNNKDISLKHIIFGGEIANEDICFKLSKIFTLYNAYGPSEATICSSMNIVMNGWTNNNIGQPLKGYIYSIVQGELHIGGDSLAIGYYNKDLNDKFYEFDGIRWFKSGDIVEYSNNQYFYKGRADRQFKHNGQLICPEEIETQALKAGAVYSSVEYLNGQIILYYSAALNSDTLHSLLPSWMKPHKMLEKEFILNQNMKVCK